MACVLRVHKHFYLPFVTLLNVCYCFNLDEELRKKYDVYGEEGLKDDHFDGGHYQSWNYFNEEFGKIVAFTEEMSCFNFILLFQLRYLELQFASYSHCRAIMLFR